MDPLRTRQDGGAAELRRAGIGQTQHSTPTLQLDALGGRALARLRAYEARPDSGPEPLELPHRTGAVAGRDPLVLCLAPGEWLLVSTTAEPGELLQRARTAAAPGSAVACDLSSGVAGFRVSGPASPWLLAKLSGVDFHALCAGPRYCLRTRAGDAVLTVCIRGDGPAQPSVDLYVDRSLAAYLWALLLDAAPHADELCREFGAAA